MATEGPPQRLSDISTIWTELQQAHASRADLATTAQQLILKRYGPAVYRYLLSALRDAHAAEDLTQEFGLGLVRGDFRNVQPERGRFRDYVKTVLFHLVSRYRKRQQGQAKPLAPDSPALADLAAGDEDADREFRDNWRKELLARTWAALAETQATAYTVLRFRAAHAKMPSGQMAEQVSQELGKSFTAEGVRQALHRARVLFGDLLLREVAYSVQSPTVEEVERELQELDLLVYCRSALDRLKRKGPAA
jgi:RNA polymerase sigma-70 factor (ECF subfamily)